LAAAAPEAADRVSADFVNDAWWDPFLDKLLETVAERSKWLGEMVE
jgi:hypothetical protein